LGAYWVKFSLQFLDRVPGHARVMAAVERLRPRLEADGSLQVQGGTDDERLRPLVLSDRPGRRSRVLFDDDRIDAELDVLKRGQEDDGGWTFDWLAWTPGQSAETRGLVTVQRSPPSRPTGASGFPSLNRCAPPHPPLAEPPARTRRRGRARGRL